MVPPMLTEDQWALVENLFPKPKKQSRIIPPRLAFEAALYKVRCGLMWKDLPEHVTQGHRPQSLYQRALEYLKNGVWERAVCVLGDYDGTSVPPLYGLPDLHITGTFDPRLSAPAKRRAADVDASAQEGAPQHVSSCSWPTPVSSAATTARFCAPCNGPPTASPARRRWAGAASRRSPTASPAWRTGWTCSTRRSWTATSRAAAGSRSPAPRRPGCSVSTRRRAPSPRAPTPMSSSTTRRPDRPFPPRPATWMSTTRPTKKADHRPGRNRSLAR